MNASILEKTHCCGRAVATPIARFSAFSGMRRTLSTRRQAAARYPVDDEAERSRERRYKPSPKSHGRSWLVWSRQSQCSHPRTENAQPAHDDATRRPAGLQPICTNHLSTRLRHREAGRSAGVLPDQRLQRPGWIAWYATDERQVCVLATCPKNANGNPATVRSTCKTFRHGTKCEGEVIKNQDFVPPRYKSPCFSGLHRSAMGHLYKLAICRESSRC
jgi:hypothetical protein